MKNSELYNFIPTRSYTVKLADTKVNILIDSTFNPHQANNQNAVSVLKTIHYHSDYECFFVKNKSLSITTESFTEDIENSIVIIPPCFRHFSVTKNQYVYRFLFSISKLKNKSPTIYSDLIRNIDNIIKLPLNEEIIAYLNQLNLCFQEKRELNEIKINALFTLLFTSLFENFISRKSEKNNSVQNGQLNYVSIIEQFINNNYKESPHLDTLAKKLHLSTKQTSRILKKQYNSTLSQLINEKRLTISCMLLKNTSLKISEIIEQTGFENESYFYVLFKKKYKISPLSYRKYR